MSSYRIVSLRGSHKVNFYTIVTTEKYRDRGEIGDMNNGMTHLLFVIYMTLTT
jgi:hypothetical protein